MKIDFIIPELNAGGAQRVMILLAEYFSVKGHIVTIITLNSGEQYELSDRITRVRLHQGGISNHKIRCLVNLLKYYKKASNRPDILIGFLTHVNLLTIITAKIYRIKVIVSEHNSHHRVPRPKWLTKITRNAFYPLADYLTVLTKYDMPFYTKRNCNVVVMPNPCSFDIVSELNPRQKTIVAVGNLNRYHHKGFDNLIKIIAPILLENPDWNLQILGGGEFGLHFLSNLVKDYKIEKQVTFVGFTDKVQEYMRLASIFVLSSRYEGLPMVLIEAMSQGVCCIAYDCKTGPSDIISHEQDGILVEDQNIEAMRDNILQLIHNPELRLSLASNGLKSLSKFSIENIYQKWETLMNDEV